MKLELEAIDAVKKAMRMEDNPREWLNCTRANKQMAQALELYRERGEYTGTFESAVECLTRAQYLEDPND